MLETIFGGPLDTFSALTLRVEETTTCTIHTLMSSVIVRAALGKTTSIFIVL